MKFNRDHILAAAGAALAGYYLGFPVAGPVKALLYLFMPPVNTTPVVVLYSHLFTFVLGGMLGYLLYGLFKLKISRRHIQLAGFAGLAALVLVVGAFSAHTALYQYEQNSRAMDSFNVSTSAALRISEENGTGTGLGGDLQLRRGNSDLVELSKLIGGMKPLQVGFINESTHQPDTFFHCAYTILGRKDSRFLMDTDLGITERVRGSQTAVFDGARVKEKIEALKKKYLDPSKVTAIQYGDYDLFSGYNPKWIAKEYIPEIVPALTNATDAEVSESQRKEYQRMFDSGIQKPDREIYILQLVNRGLDYEASVPALYDNMHHILMFKRDGPFLSLDLSRYLSK